MNYSFKKTKVPNTEDLQRQIIREDEEKFNKDLLLVSLDNNTSLLELITEVLREDLQQQGTQLPLKLNKKQTLYLAAQIQEVINKAGPDRRLTDLIVATLTDPQVKSSAKTLQAKTQLLDSLVDFYSFKLPKGTVYLQKKAKISGSQLLRVCFMTEQFFGQMKNNDVEKSRRVPMVSSSIVKQTRPSEQDENKDLFPWLDKSEIRDYNFRLIVEDKNDSKKKHVLYVKNFDELSIISSQMIWNRISANSRHLKETFKTIVLGKKVAIFESFYRTKIKAFFRTEEVGKKLEEDSLEIAKRLVKFSTEAGTNVRTQKETTKPKKELILIPESFEEEEDLKKIDYLTLLDNVTEKRPFEKDKELYLKNVFEKTEFEKITQGGNYDEKIERNNSINQKIEQNQEYNQKNSVNQNNKRNSTDQKIEQNQEYNQKNSMNQNNKRNSTDQKIEQNNEYNQKSSMNQSNKRNSTDRNNQEINNENSINRPNPDNFNNQVNEEINQKDFKDEKNEKNSNKQNNQNYQEVISPKTQLVVTEKAKNELYKKFSELEIQNLQPSTPSPTNQKYMNKIISESHIYVLLEKVVIRGTIPMTKITKKQKESSVWSDWLLETEMSVEGHHRLGNSKSTAIVEELRPDLVIFRFQNWLKVDATHLPHIRVSLVDVEHSDLLYTQIVSFEKRFNFLSVKNDFTVDFKVEYQKDRFSAVGHLSMYLFPKRSILTRLLADDKMIRNQIEQTELLNKKWEKFFEVQSIFYSNFQFLKESRGKTTLWEIPFSERLVVNSSLRLDEIELMKLGLNKHTLDIKCVVDERGGSSTIRDFKSLLKSSLKVKSTIKDLCNSDQTSKKSTNLHFETYKVILSLLTNKERMWMHRLGLHLRHEKYLGIYNGDNKIELPVVEFKSLFGKLESHLKRLKTLTRTEKSEVFRMFFGVLNQLSQNRKNDVELRVHLSHHHIPLIVGIVLAHHKVSQFEDLKSLLINAILSTLNLSNFSRPNCALHMDALLNYFRLVLETLYPSVSVKLSPYLHLLDSQLVECFSGCFASVASPLQLTKYIDLREYLAIVLVMNSRTLSVMDDLDLIGLTPGNLVDVVFLVNCVATNIDRIDRRISHASLSQTIREELRRDFADLSDHWPSVLKVLQSLCERRLLSDLFVSLQNPVSRNLTARIPTVCATIVLVRSMGIEVAKIRKLIDTEIVNKNEFAVQLVGISHSKHTPIESPKHLSKGTQLDLLAVIDEDVYFQTQTEEVYESKAKESEQRVQLTPVVTDLVNIKGMDVECFKEDLVSWDAKEQLDSLWTLNEKEVDSLLQRHFSPTSEQLDELRGHLLALYQTRRVPVIRLLVLLISCFSDSQSEMQNAMSYLLESLTQILFPVTSKQTLSSLASHVLSEMLFLVPISFNPIDISTHFESLISRSNTVVSCHLDIDLIRLDLTSLMVQHFRTNSFIAKKPVLFFGKQFCERLKQVILENFNRLVLKHKKGCVEVVIEFLEKGIRRVISVPFKIVHQPEFGLVCKCVNVVPFSGQWEEKDLIRTDQFESCVEAYWTFISSLFKYTFFRINQTNLKINFSLKRKNSKEAIFRLSTTFDDSSNVDCVCFAAEGKLQGEDQNGSRTFGKNSASVVLKNHFIFSPLLFILGFAIQIAKEELEGEDAVMFVELFCKSGILKKNERLIHKRAFLWDLADLGQSKTRVKEIDLDVEYS